LDSGSADSAGITAKSWREFRGTIIKRGTIAMATIRLGSNLSVAGDDFTVLGVEEGLDGVRGSGWGQRVWMGSSIRRQVKRGKTSPSK
jgi:hypothetical protein